MNDSILVRRTAESAPDILTVIERNKFRYQLHQVECCWTMAENIRTEAATGVLRLFRICGHAEILGEMHILSGVLAALAGCWGILPLRKGFL